MSDDDGREGTPPEAENNPTTQASGAEAGQPSPADARPVSTVVAEIGTEIERFVRAIEAIRTALDFGGLMVMGAAALTEESLDRFIDKHGTREKTKDGKSEVRVPVEHEHEFQKVLKQSRRTALAWRAFPRITLVALVSQYDAFLQRLIRALYLLKPELIESSEKELTASQVLTFSSFDDVKDYIIEKETESLLRESHIEQFRILESKFKIPLRKGLKSWSTFVELTERRNLFVHTDGTVSRQYLEVCRREEALPNDDIKLGAKLDVKAKYFERSFECIFEIGFKLGQVLWRKLAPEQMDKADSNLIDVTYELIADEQYQLADELLMFGTEVIKKHATDATKRTLVINRAQVLKWQGRDEECKKALATVDWSACSTKFRLAVDVLNDRLEEAAQAMATIGPKGEISKQNYLHWPLFKEFRSSEAFKVQFREIFSEEPAVIEDVKTKRGVPAITAANEEIMKLLAESREAEAQRKKERELEAGAGDGESGRTNSTNFH